MTTAATSFVFSNASTRTRNSFGRSASASQMVDRLFSAALHRGSAQRSSDGAVTTATDGEGVAASPTSDRRRRDFTTIRVVVEDAPPAHAARGAPVRLLDVPDRRPPAVDRGPKHEGRGPLVVHAAVQARPGHNSCKRFGECSKDDTPVFGGDVDKHGCKKSAGYHWNGSECARSF